MAIDMMIGIAGLAALLLAYLLTLFGKMDQESGSFNILNIIGALSLTYYTYVEEVYSFAVLLFAWAVVSVINMMRGKKNAKHAVDTRR
ncbi:hypothetical protein GF345_03720 [Candidatus Woesearchaeota archaeon]|nr:hypothetical protein [Candidatus Woesearchaeota archaeon]